MHYDVMMLPYDEDGDVEALGLKQQGACTVANLPGVTAAAVAAGV